MNSMKYGKRVIKVGDLLGNWTVLNLWRHPASNRAMVNVSCRCGSLAVKELQQMVGKGAIRQCKSCPRHRGSLVNTPEYKAWSNARNRCQNPKAQAYAGYGGRGIEMCSRWRDSFECFLEDMGRRPSDIHSLDRINNDGNYEPDNCRWATRVEQTRNRRSTTLLTVHGETKCISEWELQYGHSHHAIKHRLARGWSVQDAVLLPPKKVIRK